MNTDGFHMMFLEETKWMERYIVSFLINSTQNMSRKNRVGNAFQTPTYGVIGQESKCGQRVSLERECGVKEKALRGENRVQRLFFIKRPQEWLHWHNKQEDSRRQRFTGGQVIRAGETKRQENL